MPSSGGHIVLCGVMTTINDRRYPEKLGIFRFYSPRNNNDVLWWARAINRDQFKVSMSTKVC